MKKIISLFQRDYDTQNRYVKNEVVPGAEWVLAGEGIPTRKWDGTSCLVRGGKLFKRYDAKNGKTPPPGWEPCEDKPNEHTGHWPGWLPVGPGPEDKWFRAVEDAASKLPDGTYELCGPHFQGNPEGLSEETLIPHGKETLEGVPVNFEGIRDYLSRTPIEGIVWWHSDGRMVKIKARDFGINWPRK